MTRLRSRSSLIAVVAAIGSALVLVQVPPMASLLHLSPLHADDWLIAGLGGLVVGSVAAFLPSIGGASSRSRAEVKISWVDAVEDVP